MLRTMKLLGELIGESPGIEAIRGKIGRLLERQQDLRRLPPILIEGETGTGKGLLAQAIHRAGPRRDAPFVDVNCAAIPESLLEAEMFGFERGAFTDARQAKAGLFQVAHRGTIFLDEVGLLPEALQGKFLKAIEEQAVRRLGSTRSEPVDVWVLSATSVDLASASRERRFREDLYHRLAVLSVSLPPLRERGQDILLLAEHFLARACGDYGLSKKELARDARAALLAYRWPGNVRELANVMERVALLSDETIVTADALGLPQAVPAELETPREGLPGLLEDVVGSVERRHLLATLEQAAWNVTRAAARLGISRDTLRYRIEKYALRPARSQRRAKGPVPTPSGVAGGEVPPSQGVRWEQRRLGLLHASFGRSSRPDLSLGASREIELSVQKVQGFGGRVEELSPAGFVVAFGLEPIEDAPRRAAHAAVAIRKAVERDRPAGMEPAEIRIAIHVGQFLAGEVGGALQMELEGKRQAVAVLDAMVARAEPNAVLVSEAARPFLERRFELVPFGAVDPVGQTYRLVGHERSGLEVHRRMVAFVGRRQEVELLQSRRALAMEGHGQVVGIVGEAGIGKSRLLFEFRRGPTERPVTYLEGHCLSYGSTTPYLPLLDILRQHFAITEADPPDTVANKVGARLAGSGPDPVDAAPFLLRLLGVTEGTAEPAALSPAAIKARTFEVLRQVVLRSSSHRPLILVVEDLQWIDKTSEEWLASLAEGLAGASVLFLSTYRPGYRPAWMDKSYATQVALQPLGPQESLNVVHSVLTASPLPETVAKSILDKAEGNPFFLEELSLAIAETGARGSIPAVPGTVQEVLGARINRLASEAKRVLQTAAVLGRTASLPLLRHMWEGRGALDPHLRELTRLEFVYEQSGGEEPVYAFKHALTQEVAYDSLTPSRRQALHAAAGRALEALYATRLDETLDRLAYHYSRSEQAGKAVEYLSRFADKAARAYAHAEAVAALEEALAHVGGFPAEERDRVHLDLLLRLVYSLNHLGRFAELVGRLLENQDRLERLADPSLVGPYHFWLARTYTMLGDPDRGAQHGRRALAAAESAGDQATRGKALYALAYECFWSGRSAEGVEWGRQAVACLERAGDTWWLAHAHWVVAINLAQQGELTSALEAADRGLAIGEALEDRRLQSLLVATRGGFHALAGNAEAAFADCRRGVEVASDPVTVALTGGFLGGVHLEHGEAAETIPLLEQSVEAYTRFGVRQMQGWFTTLLGEAYLLTDRAQEAERLATEGLKTTTEIRYAYGIGRSQQALGRIALGTGNIESAERRLREALDTFTRIGAGYDVGRTHLDLARLARIRRDEEAIKTHLDEALRRFTALGISRYIERTRDLSAELGVPLGEDCAR